MIVKGIGEIIVPTGQSSEEAEKPKVDEIPEGTVRAALDEIQARHDQPEQSVSIVTDEKVKSPSFDQSSTDAMAAAVSTDPDARAAAAPSIDEETDDEQTGPGVADEDEIPDTVLQPLPEAPPDHPRAGKGNGKSRTRTSTEPVVTTEPSGPTPAAQITGTDSSVSVVTALTPDEQTPVPAKADAGSDQSGDDDDETPNDFDETQPPTVELDRAALLRGDIGPPRTLAADLLAPAGSPAQPDAAASAAGVDGADGPDDEDGEDEANGGAEEEMDGATIPAYDPAQFGVKVRPEDTGAQAMPSEDSAAVETVAGAPALRLPPRPAAAASVPELPHVEEAETASLSPAEVRRILDRVETLRQQAAASDAPAATKADVGNEAAAPEGADDSDAEETAAHASDEGPNYSANTYDATVAQPEPAPPGKGGNGEGRRQVEYDPENFLTVPEETLGFETTEPGEYDEGGKHTGKAVATAGAAAHAAADAGDQVAAAGIRITRRRATDAEIRDRVKSAEQSGHQLNVPPIDAAMPPPAAPSRHGSAPKVAPMTPPDDVALTPPPPHAPPATPLGTSAEPSVVEEVSHPNITRSTHSAANARLLLVLMILLAVAAGLVVLYVVLFSSQPSGQAAGGGSELGSIVLQTTPPGAQIWLDTRKQDGLTPVQIGGITFKQQHMLRFSLEGYDEEKVVFELTPRDVRAKLIEVTLTRTKK